MTQVIQTTICPVLLQKQCANVADAMMTIE